MNRKSENVLRTPALILMVLAAICLMVLLLGMTFDLAVIKISMNPRGKPYLDAQTRILHAMVMGFINLLIIRGGWSMLRLSNYPRAKNAAIMSIIPLVGPCFILGVPFGIWALVLLNRSNVKEAISENGKSAVEGS